MFIKLTASQSSVKFRLNVFNISQYCENTPSGNGSQIFIRDRMYAVNESPAEIDNLIADAMSQAMHRSVDSLRKQ